MKTIFLKTLPLKKSKTEGGSPSKTYPATTNLTGATQSPKMCAKDEKRERRQELGILIAELRMRNSQINNVRQPKNYDL